MEKISKLTQDLTVPKVLNNLEIKNLQEIKWQKIPNQLVQLIKWCLIAKNNYYQTNNEEDLTHVKQHADSLNQLNFACIRPIKNDLINYLENKNPTKADRKLAKDLLDELTGKKKKKIIG